MLSDTIRNKRKFISKVCYNKEIYMFMYTYEESLEPNQHSIEKKM